MKKLTVLLMFMVLISGCSNIGGAVAVVNPLNFTNTGFYPLLIIGELETNLSSLLIDKTKARITDFNVSSQQQLFKRHNFSSRNRYSKFS